MTLEQLIEQKGYRDQHCDMVINAEDVIDWAIEQMQAGNIKPAATKGE